MQKRSKKGISPLIATVLVIGLTVVMGAMVWVFLSTTVKQANQKFCSAQQNAEIEFEVTCKKLPSTPNNVKATIKNVGKVPLTGFRYRANDDTTKTDEMEVNPGQERTFELGNLLTDASEAITSMTFFPVIMDEGKIYTCADRKVEAQCA